MLDYYVFYTVHNTILRKTTSPPHHSSLQNQTITSFLMQSGMKTIVEFSLFHVPCERCALAGLRQRVLSQAYPNAVCPRSFLRGSAQGFASLVPKYRLSVSCHDECGGYLVAGVTPRSYKTIINLFV